MCNALHSHLCTFGIPQKAEETVLEEILPNIYIGGTYDALLHDRVLIDYKTTSDLVAKTYIPTNYKWQLLTYAWLLKQKGIEIDTIRIIWITKNVVGRISEKTGKPMKDYPSTVSSSSYRVT
ncbi:MAG: hypothetical protein KGV43_02920, partial [Arcobacter sp.]|nr:hypothetical protein [Arcobacter sp.]